MKEIIKTLTMSNTCKCCKKHNEISAQDLTGTNINDCGIPRFFKYSCKHCGVQNKIYYREVALHILRELGEV